MLNTAIGVQFRVNDLSSKYEVVGSSDNYSFTYDLGRGSDLVDFEGDVAQKSIGLRGNYGDFTIRVFGVSDIGIRSAFIQSGISVSPPEFDGTFSFADIKISSLPEDAVVGREIDFTPTDQKNLLAVDSEYTERSIDVEWRLFPPVGHAKEGQSLGNELLSDSLLSHFSLQIRNTEDGTIISEQELDKSTNNGLQSFLNTSSVSQMMNQYTGFSFQMSDLVFDELNLDRTLALEVVSHDAFGKTATGVITGHNYMPQIEDLSYSLHGSKIGFAWSYLDTDFKDVQFRSISIPSNQEIHNPRDFDASLDYYESLNSAIKWSKKVPSWTKGQYCRFEDNIYCCKASYNRIDHMSATPSDPSSTLWSLVSVNFDFEYTEDVTSSDNVSFSHLWGRKYYYCVTPRDGYGDGLKYNVIEDGAELETDKLSDLYGFVSEVKIDNLNFIERKDDLIFRWNITDQDDNLVDLNQYKFLVSANDSPEVLGISGSLFDADTNEFLSGITEGLNSRSSTVNEDGDVVIVDELPGSKVFETFEFTREINNQIYSTGGFPDGIENFSRGQSYSAGDQVIFEDTVFTAKDTVPRHILPEYEQWDASANYVFASTTNIWENSMVQFDGEIYRVNGVSAGQVIGPEADNIVGVFDFEKNYVLGDMVIAPTTPDIKQFDSSKDYIQGDFVIYSNSAGSYIYRCIADVSAVDNILPSEGFDNWRSVEIFTEIDCAIYKALTSSVNVAPSIGVNEWVVQNPETSSEYTKIIEKYTLDNNPNYAGNYSTDRVYFEGNVVLYNNDLFRAKIENGTDGPEVPSSTSPYWDQEGEGGFDILTSHQIGDIRYINGGVYKCLANNPDASPIDNFLGAPELIESSYSESHWLPFWEINTGYNDITFGHVGIPESGKRSVGIELGILGPDGSILSSRSLIGFNLEPSILANGFKVDSLNKVTSTEFNFRYANEAREKVTRLQLYRSSDPDFSILDADGLPGPGSDNFVSEILGPADQTFGDNINSIRDFPPIPYTYENKAPDSRGDGLTGYYYKLLPFDDFGSGDLFTLKDNLGDPERVLIYPFHYSNSNPDGFMGPAFGKTVDAIPGPVESFQGDTAFVNYFLDWEMPRSEFLEGSGTLLSLPNDISHYEIWESQDNFLYFGAENKFLKEEENTSGYRKITGDLNSISSKIPIEELDPASGITNALHVLDSSALGPKMSITHKGEVNDKRYFWVRAVDRGGNKGPFTGKADMSNANNIVEGLELVLGQQNPTDISDFEQSITQTFPTTLALVPNNPFQNGAPNSPTISWDRHYLYMEGTGWVIGENNTSDQYVYFKPSENGEKINAEQKLILGLAEEGEKVHLLSGQITANPSFNSFDVDHYEEITQPDIDQILPSDHPSHDPLLHRGVYVRLEGNITPNLGGLEREIKSYNPTTKVIQTYTPFVGAPAVGDEFGIVRHTPLSLDLDNPLRNIKYSGNYNTSSYHPAGVGSTEDPDGAGFDAEKPNLLEDGDKIVARNSVGIAVPMWHAFANATIGTAMIEDAAISNAKIHNLTADKIRSAVIQGQDLQVGGDGNSGQIRSVGFGVQHVGEMGFDAHAHGSGPGFVISGNGSFYFKGEDKPNDPGGRLFFEGGQLTLEGNLKQRDGTDLAVVNMYANPDVFYYDEDANGDFVPNPPAQQVKIKNNWLNSSLEADKIRFKMERAEDESIVFDYDEFAATESNGVYEISGFRYNTGDFDLNSRSSFATLDLNNNNNEGFDDILRESEFDNLGVIIYASGIGTLTEASVSVNMSLQGPVGETGRSPVYRGVWNQNSCYNGLEDKQTLRGDVVYFNNADTNNDGVVDNPAAPGGDYYIAKKDSGPAGTCGAGFTGPQQPKSAGSAGAINSDYWKIFGAQFESVATKLLLADDAIITNTLSMGANDPNNPGGGSGGTIESAGFIGGLDPTNGLVRTTENYSPPGFRFKRGKSGNTPFIVADIGGEKELDFFEFESSASSNNTYEEGSIVSDDGLNYRKKSPGTLVGAVVAPAADTTNWELFSSTTKINSYIRISNSTGLIEIAGSVFDGSISSNEIQQLEPDPNNPGQLIPKQDAFGNVLPPDGFFLTSIKGNFTSFIGGGFNNKFDTEVSPGSREAEDSFSNISCGIVAGAGNEIKSKFSFIGAGFNNLCRDNFSSILGGHSNSMPNDLDPNGGSNLIGGGTYNEIDGGSNQLIGGGEHNEIDYQNSLPATIPDTVPSLVMLTIAGQEQNIRAVIDPDRMIYSKYVLGNGTDDLAKGPTVGGHNFKSNSWISSALYFADSSNFNLYLHGGMDPETFGEWAFVSGFLGSNKSSFIYISPLWTGSNSWETNRALGIAASAWFYIDGGPFAGWIWSQQNLTGSGGDAGHYIYSNTKNSWVYIYSGSTEAYCYNESQTYSTW